MILNKNTKVDGGATKKEKKCGEDATLSSTRTRKCSFLFCVPAMSTMNEISSTLD
jgi:hypothetical protein